MFESLTSDLKQRYPAVQFSMYCDEIGSVTEYQGWHLGIDDLWRAWFAPVRFCGSTSSFAIWTERLA